MASNAHLFGDDIALSVILATDDSREQKRLDRPVRYFDHDFWQQECEDLVLRGNLETFSQKEKMHLALVHTGQRRLFEASPHGKLWGIGLWACDPKNTKTSTVKCATLAATSSKKIAKISSRKATLRHSHKKMRYPLRLGILANAASPKPDPMINRGAPA